MTPRQLHVNRQRQFTSIEDIAMIRTPRLALRRWEERDRIPFAAMNANPEVMHDMGGPISREASDAKLDRYAARSTAMAWTVG